MWNVADGGELIDPATRQVREDVTRKYNPENWEDYAFQPANRIEANLKIGGGNDKTSYYTSFGYLKDQGYSINSDFERISTRLNLTHQVRDWLSGSVNLGYAIAEIIPTITRTTASSSMLKPLMFFPSTRIYFTCFNKFL